MENNNDGDEIFIFGFSRGVFTARALAGLIAIDGILKAGSPIGVSELVDRYKKGNEQSIWKLKGIEASGDTSKLTDQEKWLLKYSKAATRPAAQNQHTSGKSFSMIRAGKMHSRKPNEDKLRSNE
ncbi:DUF2235 domain-containing protein [Bradyrhizobium sp. CSA207]|uniref:phospholipase effector Tle1 domain-containing protein n=1 Tax=Bradyrhizobium sp. CSA207 TaxID=2698826 RepID=UPI0023AF2D71|nr:DUF2235 domain-containing protein [Bradyrhizobium sp. CSA207]